MARPGEVLSEVAYLRRAIWVLMNLVEFLMARIKKITRQSVDVGLADKQSKRRQARLDWINLQIDVAIKMWPAHKEKLELYRIELHEGNDVYCDALDDTDLAVINRVTVIVGNATMDMEDRIDERLSQK